MVRGCLKTRVGGSIPSVRTIFSLGWSADFDFCDEWRITANPRPVLRWQNTKERNAKTHDVCPDFLQIFAGRDDFIVSERPSEFVATIVFLYAGILKTTPGKGPVFALPERDDKGRLRGHIHA